MDQKGIQHVCGMIITYQTYYLFYQVNVNILFCRTIQKGIVLFYWNQQILIEKQYKNIYNYYKKRRWSIENYDQFNLTISQENLKKWPLIGDITSLNDIITISIPEEIVQKHKDEIDNIELHTDEHVNKTKSYNIFKDEKTPALHPCKTNLSLKKSLKLLLTHQMRVLHVYMILLLTQNESTVKLKQKEVISLTEFFDMNKNRFAWTRAFPTMFRPEYIEGK